MKLVERYDMEGDTVPSVTFHTRVRDDSIKGDNPYKWQDVSTDELFKGKRVLVQSLPGCFTPTCTNSQLPDYEKLYDQFIEKGLDEVYCLSVNDSFVMNKWAKDLGVKKMKMIPDGSGLFTNGMGMLVSKDNLGFGQRSWRYAVVLNNRVIEKAFIEPGFMDNCPDDPYGETDPNRILEAL
jgi:thioredoxin-dependent peroxiredoxin